VRGFLGAREYHAHFRDIWSMRDPYLATSSTASVPTRALSGRGGLQRHRDSPCSPGPVRHWALPVRLATRIGALWTRRPSRPMPVPQRNRRRRGCERPHALIELRPHVRAGKKRPGPPVPSGPSGPSTKTPCLSFMPFRITATASC
jgi:hypothetical protein